MTEDETRATMLLAKASWFYEPADDEFRGNPLRGPIELLSRDLPLYKLYGEKCRRAVIFIENRLVADPETVNAE